jgi:type II secretory pathway pseudopilin PulG
LVLGHGGDSWELEGTPPCFFFPLDCRVAAFAMCSLRSPLPVRTRRRAFSLVEALIALTVMAMAGSVLLLSVESSLQTTTDAVDRTIADGLAQQLLDQALTKKYTEAAVAGGGTLDAILGAIGAAADELLGVGTEMYDDVDDYSGYTSQPPEDIYGQPLGTGDDAGGQRLANFRVPGTFFQHWQVRVEVYYVDPSNHTIHSNTTTAYRAIDVFVEKLETGDVVVPLANRKRVICYNPPPAS